MKKQLQELRKLIKKNGGHGFLIPRSDRFQGEYVAPHDDRLAFITGFTGSAGLGVVLENEAAFFTDGRYTIQAEQQVNEGLFQRFTVPQAKPESWISETLGSGDTLLYDPWLHTPQQIQRFDRVFEGKGITLKPVAENLVDKIWQDQPAPPLKKAVIHPLEFAGREHLSKIKDVSKTLAEQNISAAVISSPESVAWLLNIRGDDIPYTPLPHSMAILYSDGGVDLFIEAEKLTDKVRKHLGDSIKLYSPEDLRGILNQHTGNIMLDPTQCPMWVKMQLDHCKVAERPDPSALPRARKNKVEIQGAKDAHIRDGLALTKFLYWLDQRIGDGKEVTELGAAKHLLDIRKEQKHFKQPSFTTIASAGPNGAIVHYSPTRESSRVIKKNEIFLLDSGGQYLDGTTDITRTVCFARPKPEQKEAYTRVLKGHIALAMAIFPEGTSGAQLDVLARKSLWEAGMDYSHGTGHGVGSYLSVHEGPQRISAMGNVPLQEGMILSNEPGYYKAGEYGIRIESLVYVKKIRGKKIEGRQMLCFETISCAPIDLKLVKTDLLTEEEKVWLNDYHSFVRKTLSVHLPPRTKSWLTEVTKKLS